jgi:hypothetical protein
MIKKRNMSILPIEVRLEMEKKYLSSGGSIKSLMNAFGLPRCCVKKNLLYQGVKLKGYDDLRKIYSINNNFFKNVENWTEKQAYFYGWLYSDGCCSGNHISIGLSQVDLEILKKLNSIIENTGPIAFVNKKKKFIIRGKELTTKETCSLNIYSKEIAKDIKSLGIQSGKSEVLGYPEWLNQNLSASFLRGVFEGDGCIYVNPHDCYVSLICCEPFVNGLNSIAHSLNLKFKQFGPRYSNGLITTYRISGRRKCLKFLNFLYKDHNDLILKRKYQKYIDMVNLSSSLTKTFKEDVEANLIIKTNNK